MTACIVNGALFAQSPQLLFSKLLSDSTCKRTTARALSAVATAYPDSCMFGMSTCASSYAPEITGLLKYDAVNHVTMTHSCLEPFFSRVT